VNFIILALFNFRETLWSSDHILGGRSLGQTDVKALQNTVSIGLDFVTGTAERTAGVTGCWTS